jgi:hypothetical protein
VVLESWLSRASHRSIYIVDIVLVLVNASAGKQRTEQRSLWRVAVYIAATVYRGL